MMQPAMQEVKKPIVMQQQEMMKPQEKRIQPDANMYEEEKGSNGPTVVNDLDGAQTCPYCKHPISPKDEQAGNVGMFMETNCYHTFHLSCFKTYALKACLKYSRKGNEPNFEEPKCGHCNA
jgi:hypothetical protein